MPVSSVQSGYQIIDMSSKMAEDAALEIQQNQQLHSMANKDGYEFNKVEFKAPASDFEPLTKLTSAEQYSRIGTNVLQRDQEMIGTLLDIHV